jgi:hypothetical protein
MGNSFERVPMRFPSAINSIDINSCKQLICDNFGFHASTDENNLSKNYRYIISSSGKLDDTIKCKACANRNEESHRLGTVVHLIKSNEAISDPLSSFIIEHFDMVQIRFKNPYLFRK